MRKLINLLLIATLAIGLTGCGFGLNSETNETSLKTEGSYPIYIEHAFGTTVIKSKPERIATISWGNQDVVLALNKVPVGVSKANFGKLTEEGLAPWTKEAFTKLGVNHPVVYDDTDGLDFEAIANSKPDVILASYSGLTQEDYNMLSQIAPVVAYPHNPWQTYWRQQTLLNAKGMGVESEGEQLVKDTENLISKKLSDYPQIKGKTAAFIWVDVSDTSTFYVYLESDPRAAYLTDLGLIFPSSLKEKSAVENSFSLTLSLENADILNDVDILVTYGDKNTLSSLQKDSILGKIPAIQRGSVVVIDSGSELAASATPTVLSIPATIDEYLMLLDTAAGKV